jgi:uncharacterized protein
MGSLVLAAPSPKPEQQQAQQAQFEQTASRQYEIKRHGTIAELVHLNLTDANQNRLFFQLYTGRLWITYGLFLLGICAGRMRLFEQGAQSRRFFQRLLVASGIAAAIATVVVALNPLAFERSLRTLVVWYVSSVQHSVLAAFYVSAVSLLLWKPAATALSRMLEPMGRAGLTTYLSQSVFGVGVFYGIGLGMLGKLGVAASVSLAIGFYVLQLLIARWWMRRFRYGPVEWLWRSLTDLRPHPLRLTRVSARAAA